MEQIITSPWPKKTQAIVYLQEEREASRYLLDNGHLKRQLKSFLAISSFHSMFCFLSPSDKRKKHPSFLCSASARTILKVATQWTMRRILA